MSARLLRSTAVFSAMTFLSRISGLLRDLIYAQVFGASAAMDAFVAVFRIPNFLRRLSAEGSFSMAFVPVLAQYKADGDQAAVKALVDRVAGALIGALLVITAAAIALAPWLISVVAPGFVPGSEQWQLAVDMLRITFPYALFISLAAMVGGILNSYGRFAIPALSPILLNVSMIVAALWGAPLAQRFGVEPVFALAWGVFAAGIGQLVFQLPSLFRLGLLPRPRWDLAHAGVRRIGKLMVPTLFGASVAQFNLLFNTFAASLLVGGSMTWLYYSDRLLEFPLGMFGVAIGTVILPHLSSRVAAKDPAGYSRGLDWGLRLCLLIGIPAGIGLVLCAEALLFTLFQYGNFSPADARMSAWSLVAQALAVPAFLLVKVLAPAFFSRQDTRTPVKAGLVSVLINALATLGLVAGLLWLTPMGQAALAQAGGSITGALKLLPGAHALLALAIAIAGWANALQLAWYLRRAGVFARQPGWGRFALQLALASVAMVAMLLWLRGLWPDFAVWSWAQRGWRLAAMVAAGAACYGVVLLLCGYRPRELRAR